MTVNSYEARQGDRAPGEDVGRSANGRIKSYLVGLALAVFLTASSFVVASTHIIYGPAIPAALMALAVAQMGVHLVFFLHITTAPDNTNNVLALAFGIFVVCLVIGGSLWIMGHLNQTMMPMQTLIDHQR